MHLSQMFPKKTLDAEDLRAFAPTGAIVTIEQIDYKTLESRSMGEPEIAYYVKTREFRKPFKLNKTNAFAIAQVLGTEETKQWVGQTVRLMPAQISVTDRADGKRKKIWTFDVDMMRPTEAPSLAPGTDITGAAHDPRLQLPRAPAAPQVAGGEQPIGMDKALEIASALHERGRNMGDLEKHLQAAGLGQQLAGRFPPEWPSAVLPLARSLCGMFPRSQPPLPAAQAATFREAWAKRPQTAEVIDTKTGEVIAPGQQVEDDIPF